jgi:uncharacterized protein (UPF0333 family)
MDWFIIGPLFIVVIICGFVIWYSIKKVKKSAEDVISKAKRLMESMEVADNDLTEIRLQIRELSDTLNEVEDCLEDDGDILEEDFDEKEKE